jgi:hypothetical protein
LTRARANASTVGVSASVRATSGADRILDGIERSFGAASDGVELAATDVRIAGLAVRLRSPDPTLLSRLARAFAHLAEPAPSTPDLTVDLWDSVTTGAPPPPTPDIGSETAPGAFFHFEEGSLRVAHQLGAHGERDGRTLSGEEAPTPASSAFDSERNRAWYWVEDAGRIPYWDESAPLRYILDWWLRDNGVHLVHAGAVGTPHGGAILVGKGGSGKSTSTLAALRSELDFAGDDYVGVSLEPSPWVHSLFSTGKLVPEHAERLPFLAPVLTVDPSRNLKPNALGPAKAVVYANEHWPERVTAGFPLRAILVPRVTPERSEARIVPISRSMALAALAPSTVLQMHVDGRDSLERMRHLAQSAPCFVLEAGSDIPSIPSSIAALLAELEQPKMP